MKRPGQKPRAMRMCSGAVGCGWAAAHSQKGGGVTTGRERPSERVRSRLFIDGKAASIRSLMKSDWTVPYLQVRGGRYV